LQFIEPVGLRLGSARNELRRKKLAKCRILLAPAKTLHRTLGVTLKTAWFMSHRIREGMRPASLTPMGGASGVIEVDETYMGGLDKNRHWDKKRHVRGTGDKTPIIGAISRKGNVVCKMIERADMPTMHRFVAQTVSPKVSLVATDEHSGYQYLDRWIGMPHQTVNHRQGEYVRGIIHTNNMESFWSLLKRGIMGTYHNVSKKYLPLYLAEFSFRFNNRNNPDIFGTAIAGS